MSATFTVYQQLKVKEVTYELGDETVTATCEVNNGSNVSEIKIQMTHSDLNRIIAKISALGYEFKVENVIHFELDNGVEVIDYKFENVFGELVTLDEFSFNQRILKIRA
ncbi:hypothetical protein K6119_12820 [Paracrocinitomix mangrovi]|uniref:hypothetical protein n=1 Tax=Paracrocinitomix mangrovi TaxID=2862509 RepID=UPI001C8DE8FC|nr:hypothetical protein [Paracrocinitomix mangrovi]UKN00613.1 hypothetical protein K6119_12820 [Paracrocinitomix mangrovi]